MKKTEEQKANELYEKGDWQGFLDFFSKGDITAFSDDMYYKCANAHHQLKQYDDSITMFQVLTEKYPAMLALGASARRMEAHGLLQRDGDIAAADELMRQIPESLDRDNLRADIFLKAAYADIEIMPEEIIAMANKAIALVPHKTVNGHIINNAAFAMHIARKQEKVKPYLPILPGLIEIAIGIYEATNTAKNHIAGACGRGSLIFEAAGENYWKHGEELAGDARIIWIVLNNEQEGKYQAKVEEAEAQCEKIKGLRETSEKD